MDTKTLREHVAKLPRFSLGHLPTPLEHAARFSQTMGGPAIHVKRDDCTGLAFGGNKTRHNEFLIADALAKNADIFVWGAGVQSNNCRQTAAACAKAGLDCHLILGRGTRSNEPVPVQGSLLLDHPGTDLDDVITARAVQLTEQGRNVYVWDRDTVKPLAAVSYILCLLEIVEQAAAQGFVPDAVYVCSAGSTGSGLALATKALGLQFPVRSVCPIRWDWDTQEDMTRIANKAAELIGIDDRLTRGQFDITFDYIGPGYGKVSTAGMEAIALMARTEGLLLDPIYSGKALAGLIDHVRGGRFNEEQHVVFVHTGGTPALFAYHDELTAGIAARTLP
ncbi:MAG: D-cysteine desulfhydrase family protein [Planctomycetes bacterium]|nr:D-cysteine desulfhydrase family protein [Planctomycetota bacterium]